MISALERVSFLNRLAQGSLPLSDSVQQSVRDIHRSLRNGLPICFMPRRDGSMHQIRGLVGGLAGLNGQMLYTPLL